MESRTTTRRISPYLLRMEVDSSIELIRALYGHARVYLIGNDTLFCTEQGVHALLLSASRLRNDAILSMLLWSMSFAQHGRRISQARQ